MKRILIRLIVVGLLATAIIAYWHWYQGRQEYGHKAQRISCINNLKQIGLAFKIWEGDRGDQFPFQISTNAGGTLEWCERDKAGFDLNAYRHFQVMSNELFNPIILICPQDWIKKAAADWSGLQSANVTYQLHTGTNVIEAHPREIFAICPVDGNILYVDGSVEKGK